jgi:hypothetical protein
MNPFFFQVYRADRGGPPPESPAPAIENPATAHDRAYIAAQSAAPDGGMVVYERLPLAGEWQEAVSPDTVVRVFVINAWTTVRVLHTAAGTRVGDPVMDCWRAAVTPSGAV